MSHSFMVRAGALLALAAVALGAYGAHGLEDALRERFPEKDLAELGKRMEWFETAVRYQLAHALALFTLGLAGDPASRAQRFAAGAFLVGSGLFAGSLYGLTLLSDTWRMLGAITPLGGLALLVGWAAIAWRGR